MTERRFTDKPDLDPEAVRSLAPTHPAIEVTADNPDRLLVSGRNNRKLGETVIKGKFSGYALYGLSLEERATCPADCSVSAACYGNGMQYARRHRIRDPDVFYDRLASEIENLLDENLGLLIRLHVLGDFPSVDYVAFWADILDANPRVAIYGYTHWRISSEGGGEIGDAVKAVKERFPDRFRIRWSAKEAKSDGAVVIDFMPSKPRIDLGLVCPAQTNATACCASCALCWEAKHETIVFIKHGPKSLEVAAAALKAAAPPQAEPRRVPPAVPQVAEHKPEGARGAQTRPVAAINLPSSLKPNTGIGRFPEARRVRPQDLRIEEAYQRDLSGKSIKLLRKIVSGWDWAKFKPPVCADTPDGLFVIDGQHTAIAAASHPEIDEIPVLVVSADVVEKRADAFVAHNRDRLAMSALQIFLAEVAAGDWEACGVLKAVTSGGCTIPRSNPMKGRAKPGEMVAISAARKVYRLRGEQTLNRVAAIAAGSRIAPISSTIVYGLDILLTSPLFAKAAIAPNDDLAQALASIRNIESAAQRHAVEAGYNRYRACAALIAKAAHAPLLGAAA